MHLGILFVVLVSVIYATETKRQYGMQEDEIREEKRPEIRPRRMIPQSVKRARRSVDQKTANESPYGCGGAIEEELKNLKRGPAESLIDNVSPYFPTVDSLYDQSFTTSSRRRVGQNSLFLVEGILSGVRNPFSLVWSMEQAITSDDFFEMMRMMKEKFISYPDSPKEGKNPYVTCHVSEKTTKSDSDNFVFDHTFLIQKDGPDQFRIWQSSPHDYSLYDWITESKIKRKYFLHPEWVPEHPLEVEKPVYGGVLTKSQIGQFIKEFRQFANPNLRQMSGESSPDQGQQQLSYSQIDALRSKLFWTKSVKYTNVSTDMKLWKVNWNENTISPVYESPDVEASLTKIPIEDSDEVLVRATCRLGYVVDSCKEDAKTVFYSPPYNGLDWSKVFTNSKGWNLWKMNIKGEEQRKSTMTEDEFYENFKNADF